MTTLEDIIAGVRVKGLAGQDSVSVVSVIGHSPETVEVIFKTDSGVFGSQLVYRSDESALEIVNKGLPFSFDADGGELKLVSEAYRIRLAHLFDPYLAVHTSDIEPLPHQITAVYQEMLARQPLRFLLADDPGAGKTIMTGLLIKELMVRGDLKRCLIVAPGSLVEQWQDELWRKFHVKFEILTSERSQASATGNAFMDANLAIARLDTLARNEIAQGRLKATDWDLIVCDEAHKMSATYWAGEIKYTKRYHLGQILSKLTRHFLLLTATPHNGKEQDFQLFLSLIDGDRFESSVKPTGQASLDLVMRRLVKEELLKFDGTPLFPERRAYTVSYDLAPNEARLYAEVTEYVRAEFNRADALNGDRKVTVGFALTTLQRRLASSPEAIYQSLGRRRDRLKSRLDEEKSGRRDQERAKQYSAHGLEDDDDWPSGEFEELEEKITDQATAANTIEELEAEIATLRKLEDLAAQVRSSGEDRKWKELAGLLRDNVLMANPKEGRQKLIIFTEHRDTLRYLTDKIRALLANDAAVVNIHGGLRRDERRKMEEQFKNDQEAFILVATDAAGEGINLQRAHLMVNYDLPWNPNRLEQRFGRIHRIGQMEVCHLWNLVAKETREGLVFQILFDKLEKAREALGGKVFDVLGRLTFDNLSLKNLLIEAVRYNNDWEVRKRLSEVVGKATDMEALLALTKERILTQDAIDISVVTAIKEDMERREAHKTQPFLVESFFIKAFRDLGGKIHPRETGRFEITHTPQIVLRRDLQIGVGTPVTSKYERVCFDKKDARGVGLIQAELLCPGHPLLAAVLDLVLETSREVLKKGAILVNENDYGLEPKILYYLESAIQDNTITRAGTNRIISQRVHYVEIDARNQAKNAGYSPYLDYRPLEKDEEEPVRRQLASLEWLKGDLEKLAISHAIDAIIPEHIREVKTRKLAIIEKTVRAVNERLTMAIRHWDYRAIELEEEEKSGKTSANLDSRVAKKRATDLAARLENRRQELEKEKMISSRPPRLVGSALIVPLGLIHQITGAKSNNSVDVAAKKAAELAGMRAVMAIERSLGFEPMDVSEQKIGYDVESVIPWEKRGAGSALRFIEVKGRVRGADSVSVSKNEIITAQNKNDDFILALVELDGEKQKTWYIKKPFVNSVDFTVTSVNFDISKLKEMAFMTFPAE
ncbi:MAG: DUF3883 domain-containing protein [Deltaproteobacteria bacterium]|jgi:SNF2 family DNA or RNA helicase|nr:DUF3883 domain-containing protein [Deltaproteobacteria bacterium]